MVTLTTFDTDDLVLKALRLGASGFLLTNASPCPDAMQASFHAVLPAGSIRHASRNGDSFETPPRTR